MYAFYKTVITELNYCFLWDIKCFTARLITKIRNILYRKEHMNNYITVKID